jgi:hypothetical protein
MTVLSVKQVRGLGDELQRDPLQHANHAVSLLNCIKADVDEVRPSGWLAAAHRSHWMQQQQ